MSGPGIGALPARHEVSAMLALFGDDFLWRGVTCSLLTASSCWWTGRLLWRQCMSMVFMHFLSVYKLETINWDNFSTVHILIRGAYKQFLPFTLISPFLTRSLPVDHACTRKAIDLSVKMMREGERPALQHPLGMLENELSETWMVSGLSGQDNSRRINASHAGSVPVLTKREFY